MKTSFNCSICPRNCLVNRATKYGYCRQNDEMEISWSGLHFGEEPPISGTNGSGTIFFCGCNLACVYCQNWQISQRVILGKKYTPEKLSVLMLDLQEKEAQNINLVSPTIWTIQLIKAIKIAKKNGLSLPIIWNTNGYEKVETVKLLNGLVDIYLPDYKYSNENLARKYSGVSDYVLQASAAIIEMQKQVGDLVLDKNGVAQKGMIVRHLIIPGELENTKECLRFIRSLSRNIHLSLMNQFSPTYRSSEFPLINREVTKNEFDEIVKTVGDLDYFFGWNQEFGESVKCFVPNFSKKNPFGK